MKIHFKLLLKKIYMLSIVFFGLTLLILDISPLSYLMLNNIDIILLSISFYIGKRIPFLYVLLYAFFMKDILFSYQITGLATMQFITCYLIFCRTQKMFAKQSFAMIWAHFMMISFIYTIIPIIVFYAKTGALVYAQSIKILIATNAWFPILANICMRKFEPKLL